MSKEKFVLQFDGGLYDGNQYVAPPSLSWPMPDEIIAKNNYGKRIKTGKYKRYWQSQGEAQEGVPRGAKYQWEES